MITNIKIFEKIEDEMNFMTEKDTKFWKKVGKRFKF